MYPYICFSCFFDSFIKFSSSSIVIFDIYLDIGERSLNIDMSLLFTFTVLLGVLYSAIDNTSYLSGIISSCKALCG